MLVENKAAEEKVTDWMLKIVWLRIERNSLIVVTGERSGELLRGTQGTQRIIKLKIAWEGREELEVFSTAWRNNLASPEVAPRSASSCASCHQTPAHKEWAALEDSH